MVLCNRLTSLKAQIPLDNPELKRKLQGHIVIARLFEERLTMDVQQRVNQLNESRFIEYLIELKSNLCEIENAINILIKEDKR
jgi:hypothetical protein